METEEMVPYGKAYINGWRIIYSPYRFKKGKNKNKIQCFIRKGSSFKKKILNEADIIQMEF